MGASHLIEVPIPERQVADLRRNIFDAFNPFRMFGYENDAAKALYVRTLQSDNTGKYPVLTRRRICFHRRRRRRSVQCRFLNCQYAHERVISIELLIFLVCQKRRLGSALGEIGDMVAPGEPSNTADSDEGGQCFRSIADSTPMTADRRSRRRQLGGHGAGLASSPDRLAAALRMLSPVKVSL
jgi:hypothetical protein